MHEIKLCEKGSGGNIKKENTQQSTAIILNLLQNFHKNDKKRESETGEGRARERGREADRQGYRQRETGHLKQIMFACRLRGIFMSFSSWLSRINDTR